MIIRILGGDTIFAIGLLITVSRFFYDQRHPGGCFLVYCGGHNSRDTHAVGNVSKHRVATQSIIG
jgi:hypothetical protein